MPQGFPVSSSHLVRHYLAPHVCVVEGSQHVWTQDFITSLFQKHLGTRFVFSLFMQRAVKHKRDLWRQKRRRLYIPVTSEWRDAGVHTLCSHVYVWVKTPNAAKQADCGFAADHHSLCEWATTEPDPPKLPHRKGDIIGVEKYSKEFCLLSINLFVSVFAH